MELVHRILLPAERKYDDQTWFYRTYCGSFSDKQTWNNDSVTCPTCLEEIRLRDVLEIAERG